MKLWWIFEHQSTVGIRERLSITAYRLISAQLEDFTESIREGKFSTTEMMSLEKKQKSGGAGIGSMLSFFLLPTILASVAAAPQYHNGPASSFAKFYGPVVVGSDKEVRVGAAAAHLQHHQQNPHNYNQHHHHQPQNNHHEMNTVDYVAQPLYDFSYGVTDHKTGDSHGQKERRDGHKVQGEYHVAEPSGNIRTVRYWADETGFHASVHNSDPKAAADAHPQGPAKTSHSEEEGSNDDYW